MDALTQRRVLGLAVGMTACYALSALFFALGFIGRQRAFLVAAVASVAVAIVLSTLVRPVALGFRWWWTAAPPRRRAVNVALVALRVAVVVVFARAAFALHVP